MSLTDVIEGTRQAVSADSVDAAVSCTVDHQLVTGMQVDVKVRDHVFRVDEPAPLGGTDTGDHVPVLGGQIRRAADLGEGHRRGRLDLHGFFGFTDTRPGFTDVRVTVDLDGPASAEAYEDLKRQVDEHCPVLDLFRTPTPAKTALA